MKVREQIRLKELEIGVPVVFKKLLEQNGGDICCGRVSENGKIACSCGYKGIFEEEDAEILDYYADADYLNVRAILWARWLVISFPIYKMTIYLHLRQAEVLALISE